MKQPFTSLRRLVLLALALGAGTVAQAQTYTPVALTGFTEDIIANGPGPVSGSTTADIDGNAVTGGGGYDLMAQDYVGPTGQAPNNTTNPALENTGLITSALNSAITYQLASYSANNALRLFGAGATGTLAFATPAPAAELYVIGTSGNAPSVLDITVNFAGGTSQTFTSQTIADWFATGQPNVVRERLGRVSRGDNSVQYTGTPFGPRLYQLRLVLSAANVTKNITGLTFTKAAAAGTPVLLAVTAGTFPVCAAAPTGLAAAASTTSAGGTALATACSSTSIYLSLTGLSNQSGYTFQWQSSANGTTFTDIAGATSSTYTATGQLAATTYRAVVTCLYGGAAVNSAPVQVAQSAFDACYCAPSASSGCATYAQLLKVEIPGTTLLNASTCAASPYFTVYPAMATTTATLNPGASYPLSITLGRYAKAGLWIDYDHSGTFDASEYLTIGSNSTNTSGSTATLTPTLVIPATALTGPTRMRVRTQYFPTSSVLNGTSACNNFTYGETEDYTVTIAAALACTGTPPAITLSASAPAICASSPLTLTASGPAAGTSGLSYQFQSSPAGAGTFTALGAAQPSSVYTVASQTADTDYRVVVTCTAGGQSTTSSVVSVGSTFLNCYCTALGGAANEYIKEVMLPGTPGFTNTTGAPASASGYGDFTANPALTTTLNRGTTYTNGVHVTVRSNNANSQGGLWIDYDHSGTFDASEFTLLGSSSAIATDVTLDATLDVPATALLGQTRARVRWRNGPFTGADACVSGTTTWYGETEDYLLTIAACTPGAATFSYGTSPTFCLSSPTNPSVTLGTGATAGTFSSTTGLVLNATTGAITLSSSTAGTYTVTNSVAATATVCASTATTTVTITAAPTAGFSFPAATRCAGTAATIAPTLATGATAGTYSLPTATGLSINATTGVVTVGATAAAGTYTVTNTVAAANGCAAATATSSFTLTAPSTATFSYAGPYCVGGATSPVPTITGTAGGTFTVAPATGLALNAATGALTLSGSTAGTYTVTYTVAGPCGSSSTQPVVLNAAAVATFSYATPGPGTGAACAGGTGTFAPTLGTGATAGTFAATPAGLGLNTTTGAISLATSAAGTYTVTNTVAGTCAATGTAAFTVSAAPATPTLTSTGTPATGITLTSSAATGNQFYLNGVAVPGATAATYLINSGTRNGSYTVVVTSAAGCTSAASAAVSVVVTAAGQALADPALTLYPNPTPDGQLTLILSGYREPVALSIINALGQRVYESTVGTTALSQPQKLTLNALPAGIYLLQARTASGSVVVRRVVRE